MTLSSDEKCIGNIAHTQSEPITDINSNNDERVSQVTSIFKTSKSHLQILDARRVTLRVHKHQMAWYKILLPRQPGTCDLCTSDVYDMPIQVMVP
jgi:hypothetical protein